MNERSNLISKMKTDKGARLAYIKGKLAVFIPSQIRALRLGSNMSRQADLAEEVEMQQSRISMFESPGTTNFTIDTLARLAAVFRVGLLVKFVPLSKMLQEDNTFSQDTFNVLKIENDKEFLDPSTAKEEDIELLNALPDFRQISIRGRDGLLPKNKSENWWTDLRQSSVKPQTGIYPPLNRGNENAAFARR